MGRLLTPFEIEDLSKTVKEDGTKADLIKEALREAVLNGKPNWKYIQAILRNWRHEGIQVCGSGRGQTSRARSNNPKQVNTGSADFLMPWISGRISRLKAGLKIRVRFASSL